MKLSELVVGQSYWVIHPHPQIPVKKEQLTFSSTKPDTRKGNEGKTMAVFNREDKPVYSCVECQVEIFVYKTESEADAALAITNKFLEENAKCEEQVCPYGLTTTCEKFTSN